jgi:L-asparaginase
MNVYQKKRILVIFTGGTVAGNVAKSDVSQNIKSDPNNFLTVLDNSIEIVKQNWNIEIEPEIEELFNLDSSNVGPENWQMLILKIEERYDEFDSFIVLHGTNTMGYTAAAMTFAFENINKPVIITGAQVPLGYLGSDAVTNLVNSLRLAVWGYHEVKGVMAVFGSKIIAGTRVKKGTDFDYDPFKSFQTGALGQIGRFLRINEPAMRKYVSYLSRFKPLAIQARVLSVKNSFDTASIASLTEFPGMKVELFKSLVENSGIKAFVFRAFGAGDPSEHLFEAFQYLKEKKIPIVVTTQAPGGVSSFQVNESGQYLRDNDLAIPAFDMSIESMTVKLSWLLAQGMSYEQIKIKMLEDLHGEIVIENELI